MNMLKKWYIFKHLAKLETYFLANFYQTQLNHIKFLKLEGPNLYSEELFSCLHIFGETELEGPRL